MQAEWEKATGTHKTTAQSQWDKAEALRERINKQLTDAELSVQEAFTSATSYLSQKWSELSKGEL